MPVATLGAEIEVSGLPGSKLRSTSRASGITTTGARRPEHSLTFVEAFVELCEVLYEERFCFIRFRLAAHTHEERLH